MDIRSGGRGLAGAHLALVCSLCWGGGPGPKPPIQSHLRNVLDSLYPADSREHQLANIRLIEDGIASASPKDPWMSMALHDLGMDHLKLHEPSKAVEDFDAALRFPESAPRQHLHSLQSEMVAASEANQLEKAIALADRVAAAAIGTPEEIPLAPYALHNAAVWTSLLYGHRPGQPEAMVRAYKHYLTVSATRGGWGDEDVKAKLTLNFWLQKAGRFSEASEKDRQALRDYGVAPRSIEFAMDNLRARHGGSLLAPPGEYKEILDRFPQPSYDRMVTLSNYAAMLPDSDSRRSLWEQVFNYRRRPDDEQYSDELPASAGTDIALDYQTHRNNAKAREWLEKVVERFPQSEEAKRVALFLAKLPTEKAKSAKVPWLIIGASTLTLAGAIQLRYLIMSRRRPA